MKTKQFIIPTVAFILALTALFCSHYSIATAFFLYLAVNLFVEVRSTISQLTSKLTDAEKEIKKITDIKDSWIESFNRINSISTERLIEINKLTVQIESLTTELETAKSNSYKEIERKRCREKYNRLYKGKKKAVATEQKSEPMKIEPFRMVVNPKQSAIIQQILFDNGYEWIGGDTHVKDTDIKALSFEGDKIMCYDFYPHTDSVYFEDTHLPKLSFKKFMQLYGAKEQPYTIEGKTIKQLVEENLGIKIKIVNEDMYLCGYDRRGLSHWIPFIVGINNGAQFAIDNSNAIMIERYDTEYWVDAERVINAIKKHRNIK